MRIRRPERSFCKEKKRSMGGQYSWKNWNPAEKTAVETQKDRLWRRSAFGQGRAGLTEQQCSTQGACPYASLMQRPPVKNFSIQKQNQPGEFGTPRRLLKKEENRRGRGSGAAAFLPGGDFEKTQGIAGREVRKQPAAPARFETFLFFAQKREGEAPSFMLWNRIRRSELSRSRLF